MRTTAICARQRLTPNCAWRHSGVRLEPHDAAVVRLTAKTTLTPATHIAFDTKQHFRASIPPCDKHMFVVMFSQFRPGHGICDQRFMTTPYKSIAENNVSK